MIFQDLHPETGEPVWGCPRYSFHASQWLIDWFRADGAGLPDGASIAKGEQLDWILANRAAVDAMIADCEAWQKRQIPF